jgi:hypothetical protein
MSQNFFSMSHTNTIVAVTKIKEKGFMTKEKGFMTSTLGENKVIF